MNTLNTWLPVDVNKPIPKPENARQCLSIFIPKNNTGFHKAHAMGPFILIRSMYSITCRPDADHDKYLYWDHGWLRKEPDEKVELVYDTKYCVDLLYCIIEFPCVPIHLIPLPPTV